MTSSTEAVTAPAPVLSPVGVRISSTVCWLVGIVTLLSAFAVGIPAINGDALSYIPLAFGLFAGLMVSAAAYHIRRHRRVGVLLLVFAWALPTMLGFLQGGAARGGNLLLLGALALALANWKHLR
ncbi:MAG: hypothetical protein JNL44_19570 [Gemmatimonadetes bacterium]|nr:hypothetical protein [Gemmatimonadota bacterium]